MVDHVQSWSTLNKGHGLPCYSMVCRHVISCFDLKPQIPFGVVVLDERNNLKVASNSLLSPLERRRIISVVIGLQ